MFHKAERTQVKFKGALTGPSGSGKTFSALAIARGLGKKVAVIDTENGSASLYAKMKSGPLAGFEFDTVVLQPPYSISRYTDAIQAAVRAKYDVLVIDSISHAWAGEGGLLAKKEVLDSRGGNSYTNWAGITKEHEAFKATLLNADIHLICTMRSKQDYVLETNEKGRQAPKKVGLAPIQRDGMEYEFTVVLDMGMDHSAVASKDRTSLFDGQVFKPSIETGVRIRDWLLEAPLTPPVEPSTPSPQAPAPSAPAAAPEASPPAAKGQPKTETKPATPTPTDLPEKSGVTCVACKSEVLLVKSKEGYRCPRSTGPKDGHTRFFASKLKEYQTRNQSMAAPSAQDVT